MPIINKEKIIRVSFRGIIKEEIENQIAGFDTNYFDILLFHWPATL